MSIQETIDSSTNADVISSSRGKLDIGSIVASGSVTGRPLSDRFSERFNLRDHGAIGDGVADDTAALSHAIVAASVAGGQVYIPKGTYKVSNGMTISANVQIVGDGWSSIIKATNPAVNLFTLTGSSLSNVQFRDLRIHGVATDATTNQYGIFTSAGSVPTQVVIDHVFFGGPDTSSGLNCGIKIDTGGDYWNVSRCTFQLIGSTSGAGYGILIGTSNYGIFAGNQFIGAANKGRHAIYLGGGCSGHIIQGNMVTGLDFEAFPIYSFSYQSANSNNQIVGNQIYGGGAAAAPDSGAIGLYGKTQNTLVASNKVTGFAGVGIIASDAGQGGACSDNLIIGNSVVGSGKWGIQVLGTKRARIIGNHVTGSSAASSGTYSGIEVNSTGTFGGEVAVDNWVIGNTSDGATQNHAIFVNPSVPTPTGTVLQANVSTWGAYGGVDDSGLSSTALSYSATVAIDCNKGSYFPLTVTDQNAFQFDLPTHPNAGQVITLDILNSSGGGGGAVTWHSVFKVADTFILPPNGGQASISFRYDAGNTIWVETARTPRDPNKVVSPSYGGTITIDTSLGRLFKVVATNGTGFTINAPLSPITGAVICVDIVNSSGGALGTITWDAAYKLAGAFTAPANTKRRTISFYRDGSNWVETNRAAADI